MAKIKQAFRKLSDTFSDLVFHKDDAIERSQLNYEQTIEQAKLQSYEIRRHLV